MKALTLTQPWATLIAIGAKRIETRSWSTDHRGQIAIHAAKGLSPIGGMRGLIEQCKIPSFSGELGTVCGYEKFDVKKLPLGAIVAIATLTNVQRIDMKLRAQVIAQTRTPLEIEFGLYESGRYAWFLENVIALPRPIECKGALSLWDVPEDIADRITSEL